MYNSSSTIFCVLGPLCSVCNLWLKEPYVREQKLALQKAYKYAEEDCEEEHETIKLLNKQANLQHEFIRKLPDLLHIKKCFKVAELFLDSKGVQLDY